MRPIRSPISPPSSSSSSEAAADEGINNNWGPYASAGDFKANALLVLSAVFCSVLIFLAVTSIIRFLFCASGDEGDDGQSAGPDKKSRKKGPQPEHGPVLVFTKDRQRELVGGAAECAICLSEFADGDEVRVLPACHHGFHVACVERWLSLRCSCPTCRASTKTAAAAGGDGDDQHVSAVENIV